MEKRKVIFMLDIVNAPHPALTKVAEKIGKIDATVLKHIKEMTRSLEAAKDPEGVGLAAPQVGLSLQLFIIKQTPDSTVSVFINPVIIEFLDEKITQEKKSGSGKRKSGVKLEGCLSLDNIWGIVRRHDSVLVSYLDEKGTYHKRKFSGFFATIMQHEMDHLKGILFPKRVLEQKGKLYKSVKNEDGETIFEELEI